MRFAPEENALPLRYIEKVLLIRQSRIDRAEELVVSDYPDNSYLMS